MRQKSRRQRNKRQKNRNKRIRWQLALFVCLLCIVFFFVWFQIHRKRVEKETMGYRISVYGLDISKLTPIEASEKIAKTFRDKKVVFLEKGKEIYRTTLGDLGYTLEKLIMEEELSDIKEQRGEKQKSFKLFGKTKDYSIKCEIQKDEEREKEAIASKRLNSKNRTKSIDAHTKYDKKKEEFVLIKEVQGNQIDGKRMLEQVHKVLEKEFLENLLTGKAEIKVGNNVYQKASSAKDKKLDKRLEELNEQLRNYRKATITYTFGSTLEKLNTKKIHSWIDISDDNVDIKKEQASTFISELASEYNTLYATRPFRASDGREITIQGNEYGYRIDQDAELQQLLEDLKSGESVKREPVYKKKGRAREGNDDLLGSYVEVSLDKQHLWLYKNGVLVTETDIVSGRPKEGWQTYRGAWPIAYKASPYTLSSDIYGYETTVTYWMPFVYGQGLHDADWQTSFGGERYKTNGSHGCINLPRNQAEIIYNTIEGGYPIIIY
ncbi:MAG: L,D-transpeptidase family protein [Lachnospiraceae bacterium]|nr:L,D-transpeptidase family protein [Lachnospiraceae bacterium]